MSAQAGEENQPTQGPGQHQKGYGGDYSKQPSQSQQRSYMQSSTSTQQQSPTQRQYGSKTTLAPTQQRAASTQQQQGQSKPPNIMNRGLPGGSTVRSPPGKTTTYGAGARKARFGRDDDGF